MKRLMLGALAVLSLATAGCFPATYSSISRNADGSYLLTRNKGGFFSVYGTVYHCTGAGNALQCAKIDEPG
jgi:hypothetical protein